MNNTSLTLRRTTENDLETFFLFQLDPEANHMAAFTPKDPGDKTAYMEKWKRLVSDPAVHMQTILQHGIVTGSVAKFEMMGETMVAYGIGKAFWGRGIATAALQAFLQLETWRPLYARVAFDNYGSQKVLEKCGFLQTGTDRGFANARNAEITEFVYRLDQPRP